MGKHKSQAQEDDFLNFMEEHPDLANNFVKGDRVANEALWSELAKQLNSQGPPQKDVNGWKKVWSDWKGCVRKKIAHNKCESRATGGGRFNQFVLTHAEERIAVLCGLYTSVEGISQSITFGVSANNANTSFGEDVAPSTSAANRSAPSSDEENTPQSVAHPTTPRKRPSQSSLQDCLKKHMATEAGAVEDLSDTLRQFLHSFKECLDILKESNGRVTELTESVEKLCELIAEQNADRRRHYSNVEKIGSAKNLIKKRMLQIEEEKWEMLQRK